MISDRVWKSVVLALLILLSFNSFILLYKTFITDYQLPSSKMITVFENNTITIYGNERTLVVTVDVYPYKEAYIWVKIPKGQPIWNYTYTLELYYQAEIGEILTPSSAEIGGVHKENDGIGAGWIEKITTPIIHIMLKPSSWISQTLEPPNNVTSIVSFYIYLQK